MPNRKTKELLGVISFEDAEEFLVDLANFLPEHSSSSTAVRFFRRWGEIFTGYDLKDTGSPPFTPKHHLCWFLTNRLVPVLRMAWDSPTPRERAWYAHLVREIYNVDRVEHTEEAKKLIPPATRMHFGNREIEELHEHEAAILELRRLRLSIPPISKFDAAAQHFETILSRASRCQNPVCAITPYFLATKAGQKFCSEPCARPAQQAAKKKWWAENGKGWRNQKKGDDRKRGKK